MALETDVENGEILLILLAVIVIGYGLYKGFGAISDGVKKTWESIKDTVNWKSEQVASFEGSNTPGASAPGSPKQPEGIDPNAYIFDTTV